MRVARAGLEALVAPVTVTDCSKDSLGDTATASPSPGRRRYGVIINRTIVDSASQAGNAVHLQPSAFGRG